MSETTLARGCKWPMWPHDSRPTHEYCGARRASNSSYCDKHKEESVRNPETEPRRPFVPFKRAA